MAPLSSDLEGKSPMEVGQYAKARWYVEYERGPEKVYYDAVANKGGQTRGHVKQVLGFLGVSFEDQAKVMSLTNFNVLQPSSVYRQWEDPVYLDRELGMVSKNVWRKPFNPKEIEDADVQPFLDVLEKAYGHEPEAVEFLLDTLAFRLREKKLPRQELIVLLYSQEGATAKGSVLDTIDEVFGQHAVKRTDFRSAFTDQNSGENWLGNFILLDETSVTRTQMADLKSKVSTATVSANAKNRGSVDYDINALPVLATNEMPSLDDAMARRVLLLQSRYAEMEPDRAVRVAELTTYKRWLRDGGAEEVFHWLYHRDTSNYLPFQEAPKTAAKEAVMSVMNTSKAGLFAEYVSEQEAVLYNCGQLQAEGYLSRDTAKLRHELAESGLSQPTVKDVDHGGARKRVTLVTKLPWKLCRLPERGGPIGVRNGDELRKLTEAPGYSDLFGDYDLTL